MKHALLLIALFSVGCGTIRVHKLAMGEAEPKTNGGRFEEKYSTTLWGTSESSAPIDLSKRCPYGWLTLTSRVTASQALLRVVTLGYYAPWTVEVVCASKKEAPKEDLGPADEDPEAQPG